MTPSKQFFSLRRGLFDFILWSVFFESAHSVRPRGWVIAHARKHLLQPPLFDLAASASHAFPGQPATALTNATGMRQRIDTLVTHQHIIVG